MVIIKQYNNRTMYMVTRTEGFDKSKVNTKTIIDLVKAGKDIIVYTVTGEDITHKTLAAAIKEHVKPGLSTSLHNYIRNNII